MNFSTFQCRFILAAFALAITFNAYSQSFHKPKQQNLYIPVSLNSPLFSTDDQVQLGASINTYGFNFKLSGQLQRKILIFSIQHNSGNVKFDPLHFNKYQFDGNYIKALPVKMLYVELGGGYNLSYESQKIAVIAGVGLQIENPNSRFFVQLDWGRESRLINAGLSLRASYTQVNGRQFVVIEPVFQGKLCLGNFRIINQFGYAYAGSLYPIFSVGLEYVLNRKEFSSSSAKF